MLCRQRLRRATGACISLLGRTANLLGQLLILVLPASASHKPSHLLPLVARHVRIECAHGIVLGHELIFVFVLVLNTGAKLDSFLTIGASQGARHGFSRLRVIRRWHNTADRIEDCKFRFGLLTAYLQAKQKSSKTVEASASS